MIDIARRVAPTAAGLVAFVAAAGVLTPTRVAYGCGVTVGGAVGISGCSVEEHEEATRLRWQMGASYSFTSTALRFGDGERVDEERHASLLALDYRPSRRVTFEAAAGVLLGGFIDTSTARYALSPGFVTALGGSWRVLDAHGALPFVLLTGQVSYAATKAAGAIYDALDVRLGAVAGTTLWNLLTPYVVGRGFGGPIFWRLHDVSITGQDVYHYQVGAGLSLLLGRSANLFVEGVPLGERGVAAGLGLSF